MGNAAVEEERYTEAILYYTHAIKLDPKNAVLFSNRSFALFKTQQFYYAMLDAIETIKLDPQWYKVRSKIYPFSYLTILIFVCDGL